MNACTCACSSSQLCNCVGSSLKSGVQGREVADIFNRVVESPEDFVVPSDRLLQVIKTEEGRGCCSAPPDFSNDTLEEALSPNDIFTRLMSANEGNSDVFLLPEETAQKYEESAMNVLLNGYEGLEFKKRCLFLTLFTPFTLESLELAKKYLPDDVDISFEQFLLGVIDQETKQLKDKETANVVRFWECALKQLVANNKKRARAALGATLVALVKIPKLQLKVPEDVDGMRVILSEKSPGFTVIDSNPFFDGGSTKETYVAFEFRFTNQSTTMRSVALCISQVFKPTAIKLLQKPVSGRSKTTYLSNYDQIVKAINLLPHFAKVLRIVPHKEELISFSQCYLCDLLDLIHSNNFKPLERPTDFVQALVFMYDLATAMEAMHNNKMVHWDGKADNVLISMKNNLMRADIGDTDYAAKISVEDTKETIALDSGLAIYNCYGSLIYNSPELWQSYFLKNNKSVPESGYFANERYVFGSIMSMICTKEILLGINWDFANELLGDSVQRSSEKKQIIEKVIKSAYNEGMGRLKSFFEEACKREEMAPFTTCFIGLFGILSQMCAYEPSKRVSFTTAKKAIGGLLQQAIRLLPSDSQVRFAPVLSEIT